MVLWVPFLGVKGHRVSTSAHVQFDSLKFLALLMSILSSAHIPVFYLDFTSLHVVPDCGRGINFYLGLGTVFIFPVWGEGLLSWSIFQHHRAWSSFIIKKNPHCCKLPTCLLSLIFAALLNSSTKAEPGAQYLQQLHVLYLSDCQSKNQSTE